LRVGNPECYNPDGTPKKGLKFTNRSNAWHSTTSQLARAHEHIANARGDYYHNVANEVLQRFDLVGLGNWKGLPKPKRLNRKAQRKSSPCLTLFAPELSVSRGKGGSAGEILVTI
jgi:transposase